MQNDFLCASEPPKGEGGEGRDKGGEVVGDRGFKGIQFSLIFSIFQITFTRDFYNSPWIVFFCGIKDASNWCLWYARWHLMEGFKHLLITASGLQSSEATCNGCSAG